MFNPTNYAKNVDVHINVFNPGVTKGAIHYHKNIENIYVVGQASHFTYDNGVQ